LTLAPLTTAGKISATVDGGDGDDTLAMGSADAEANSTDTDFDNAVTGFEMLYINDAAGTTEATTDMVTTTTIDLANLAYSNVITNGTNINTARDVLVLDNLASDGMVSLNGDGDIEVNVADAATGTADSLNVAVNSALGELTVADVETIHIDAAAGDSTFNVVADSVETISITGGEFVNLTDAANYAGAAADYTTVTAGTITNSGNSLTLIDASAMTGGGLAAVADGGVAQEILGGAGDDIFLAAGSGDVLNGGAGADILTGASLTQLIGGDGADTFVMNTPTNVNTYSTITGFTTGDVVDLDSADAGTVVFSSSAVGLAPTAVFQDYANEAVNLLGADTNDAAWFQFGDNTYIVQSGADHSATGTPDFQNGTDSIIQLTGLVDLSSASYNQDNGTLEVA
jgi:S-layer protein